MNVQLLRHQSELINMVRKHPEIPYVFLIAGFGAGKSFTDTAFMLFLVREYQTLGATFGLIGASIKLLVQTVLKDFIQFCTQSNIPYKDNSQKGFIQVGNVRFVYLSGADPGDIFAHNFAGVICDELDELPPDRILPLMKAIQERARVHMAATRNMPERDPWVVFTTTAQGLGGTYQLIKYFEKQGLPYSIIRARTADNPHLADSQVQLLRKLYTPDEARAYLDGEFINLSAGRVYPTFDRRTHVYMPFPINDNDILYVGADFNFGFNNITVSIERNGIIYIIDAAEVGFMGDAPRALREKYPRNKIVFVPDASGKEIMQGLSEEFTSANVEVFWNSVNPGIGERVTAINRLFSQNRLFVFTSCDKVIMSLETRDYDDNGKPRKGKGPESGDHCLDCCEYSIWRIIHSIHGYEAILESIRAVHHHEEMLSAWSS